eukprot:4698899-Amphidinium_carterae.1
MAGGMAFSKMPSSTFVATGAWVLSSLTILDLSNWALLELLAKCLKTFKHKGLLWVGRSGFGKIFAISSTISRFWQLRSNAELEERPVFKVASNLDYFR